MGRILGSLARSLSRFSRIRKQCLQVTSTIPSLAHFWPHNVSPHAPADNHFLLAWYLLISFCYASLDYLLLFLHAKLPLFPPCAGVLLVCVRMASESFDCVEANSEENIPSSAMNASNRRGYRHILQIVVIFCASELHKQGILLYNSASCRTICENLATFAANSTSISGFCWCFCLIIAVLPLVTVK